MNRRDRFILQLIVWLAVGTFLFGVWAMVVGVRKASPAEPQPPAAAPANPHPGSPMPR